MTGACRSVIRDAMGAHTVVVCARDRLLANMREKAFRLS